MADITELIKTYFPKLTKDNISYINLQIQHFSVNDQKFLLASGKLLSHKDNKVIATFFSVAVKLYNSLEKQQFEHWMNLIKHILYMQKAAIIAFLETSPILIQNNNLEMLNKWTEIGLIIEKENKTLSNFYFLYTGDICVFNTKIDFNHILKTGIKFSKYNIRLAEAYFKNLKTILSFLSIDEFNSFINLINEIAVIDWRTGVEIFTNFNEKFYKIIPENRFIFILSMKDFLKYDIKLMMSLFNRGASALFHLSKEEFKVWLSLIEKIALYDIDISIAFVDRSIFLLDKIQIDKLNSWVITGIELLDIDKNAAKIFFDYSFTGLNRQLANINLEQLNFLLKKGSELAVLSPECVENYFKYAPKILQISTSQNFREWIKIGKIIAHENSNFGSNYCKFSALALQKISPKHHDKILSIAHLLVEKDWMLTGIFFQSLPDVIDYIHLNDIKRWAILGLKIYNKNKKMSVDYFAFSPSILQDLKIEELEEWVIKGLHIFDQNYLSGMSFFSLKSKSSIDMINSLKGEANFKAISNVLKYYALGLTGIEFNIQSKNVLPVNTGLDILNPIIADDVIYLEPKINKYGNFKDNFNIYKSSIMHEIGHVQFSSSVVSTLQADKLLSKNKHIFNDKYIKINYLFDTFSNPAIAIDIMGILEDARIEYIILHSYKGISKILKQTRSVLLQERPIPETELEKLMEYLLWLSTDNIPHFKLDEKGEDVINFFVQLSAQIFNSSSSTFDSVKMCFKLYEYIENRYGTLKSKAYTPIKNILYRGVGITSLTEDNINSSNYDKNMLAKFVPQFDIGDNEVINKSLSTDFQENEIIQSNKYIVKGIYNYDEWDSTINDYKSKWCTLKEIEKVGDFSSYYDDTIKKYYHEIILIKNQFDKLKPQLFEKIKFQTDGSEIDTDAYIDNLIQKKCGNYLDDRLYIRWDKRERDIASLFLVDISASTAKKVKDQNYNIIDVEKEALIVISQAIERIQDKYAIYAFSGHMRDSVEYYLIKEFDEILSDTVAQRISLLEPVSNTRLGAAIRHSIFKLQNVQAQTKIIILLSDGEPYDTVHGESAYNGFIAEEDTLKAIFEAKNSNINFFCITVDSKPGEYLERIFSQADYTIIDDVKKLPMLLPRLYKCLTT